MQPQKLCLKWNNHTVNLLSVLGSFQQKDVLVDVTISCEGQNIKAHKMVLSACSPYFQNIFLENPCQHPIVIINGIKYEDITAILNFMYKGEVNVSQDGLSSFLQAAEALKVKGLAEVCGERKSTNSINQEAQHNEQSRPQRTDTPPRKKHRNRKRSLSDSNKSDDEGTARKHHREPSSPEIHELSGDESFTGDNTSNGPPFHSSPRVPQNVYSRSHQSSSNLAAEDDEDYEVEPSKLLEQTLTTDNVSMNNSNSDNNLRIERIMGNATEIESSNIQEPESPPDIKPIIDYGESSAGPSDGNLMLYSDHSQPGPSSVQDGSLLHDNSHAQGKKGLNVSRKLMRNTKSKEIVKKEKSTEKDKKEKVTKEVQVKKNMDKNRKLKLMEDKDKKPETPVMKQDEERKNEAPVDNSSQKLNIMKSIHNEKSKEEAPYNNSPPKLSMMKSIHDEKQKEKVPDNNTSQKLNAVKSNYKISCMSCLYSTSTSEEISRHLHTHRDCHLRSGLLRRRSNINIFECPDCKFRTRHINSIKQHMKKHTKKNVKVKPKRSPPSLDVKKTEPDMVYPFSCDVCKQGFLNLQNLEIHRKYSHIMSYKCKDCGEEFTLLLALKNHRRSHHDISD